MVNQPGWRWSTDVRPTVGGEWCQVPHVGLTIPAASAPTSPTGRRSSSAPVRLRHPARPRRLHGGRRAHRAGRVDGLRHWAGLGGGATGCWPRSSSPISSARPRSRRASATCLARPALADLRGGAGRAGALRRTRGEDHGRRDARHLRRLGPGVAVRGGDPAGRARGELQLRIGVHVGEVEVVGDDVRGVAVHEAARIMAAAEPDEILVSDLTRMLAAPRPGFEDGGPHTLKGLDGSGGSPPSSTGGRRTRRLARLPAEAAQRAEEAHDAPGEHDAERAEVVRRLVSHHHVARRPR